MSVRSRNGDWDINTEVAGDRVGGEQGESGDRQGRVGGAGGREEARSGQVEIGVVVGAAVAVRDRGRGIVAHAVGAHQVASSVRFLGVDHMCGAHDLEDFVLEAQLLLQPGLRVVVMGVDQSAAELPGGASSVSHCVHWTWDSRSITGPGSNRTNAEQTLAPPHQPETAPFRANRR